MPTALALPPLPTFDPAWPVQVQRAHIPLATRRINARRGLPDPTLSRDLAAFTMAIAALQPPNHHDTQEPAMPAMPAMPTTNGHPAPPHPAPAPPATATQPTSTSAAFDAAQWERITTAARDHAIGEIERATAQRALLTSQIAELEQTIAALGRALRAFRQQPTRDTAPAAPAAPAARRAYGEALRQALEWADTHDGVLDTGLFRRDTGRLPLSHSTITRLVACGQLVHSGGPKSGRYQRPTPHEPPTKLADQP